MTINDTTSAGYMLEGTDFSGKKYRLFIEKNGTSQSSISPSRYYLSLPLPMRNHKAPSTFFCS